MANNDIIELLDILYGMVNEAWSVPLGNDKCIIEREKAIEIINEIKVNLPTAIAEAQRLVSARDEFIGNAKREAEAMRKNAEEQARIMIEEQEIVRVARAKSNEMITSAEAKSKELRRVASEYVEQIMSETERSMQEALATVQNAHNSFRHWAAAMPSPRPRKLLPSPKPNPSLRQSPSPRASLSRPRTFPSPRPNLSPDPRVLPRFSASSVRSNTKHKIHS